MNIWFALVCMLWLGWAAWQDIRRKEVSNWLTIPPLLGVSLWWLWCGEWRVLALLVALIAIVEAMDHYHIFPLTAAILAVAAGAGLTFMAPAQTRLIAIVWSALWAIWITRLAGGADIKIVMALVGLYPDWRLVALLGAAYVTWNVYHLVRRHGKRAVEVALTHVIRAPTREELAAYGVPTVPAFAAAGWMYLAFAAVWG